MEPPKRISTKEVRVDVTGYLIPAFLNNQPVLMHVDGGGENLYLPLFSKPEKLKTAMASFGISYDKIVEVADAREFLESVALQVRVIIDPHTHENGRVRYTELFLNN